MTERSFRVWDYSPSHSRLVVRSTPDVEHDLNLDHLFTGVAWMQVPEMIRGLVVEEVPPEGRRGEVQRAVRVGDGENSELRVFRLSGRDGTGHPVAGFIVAAAHSMEENDLDLFATSLQDQHPSPEDARSYERAVIAALAQLGAGNVEIPLSDRRFDALIRSPDDRVVAVEIKYFKGRPTPRSARSVAMQLVDAAGTLPNLAAVLVITNTVDQGFTAELNGVMPTALGRTDLFHLVYWEAKGRRDDLREALAGWIG